MNEVVNGLMNADGTAVNPNCALGQICIGTGGDFRKTTGLPKEHAAAIEWLCGEKTIPLDVGRMDMTNHQGQRVVRYFNNITSIGIGGEVDDRVNRTTKAFGGFASFFWGSLTAMLGYKNKPVRLTLDGEFIGERTIFMVAVANGQYFGGGMHVAPQADLHDGLFDVIMLGDLTMFEKFTQMPKIYKAAHLQHPKAEVRRARKVVAESDHVVLLDVDGEAPGRLPTSFEVMPGALKWKVKD
jgi:YegS/Rv2252/BmrU family lipid kinase